MNRDEALLCLYRSYSALDQARSATTDTYLNARIRELGMEVLHVIGKLATAANEARTTQ